MLTIDIDKGYALRVKCSIYDAYERCVGCVDLAARCERDVGLGIARLQI